MSGHRTVALGALITLAASAGWAQTAAPPGGRPAAPTTRPAAPATKPADGQKTEERKQPTTVDADRMERFGRESLVIFTGNVVARQDNSVQYADRMEVYLDDKGDRIIRTVSTGNVRIVTKDCKMGTARRAEYFDLEQRVVLIGSARVWQEDNVVTGETITMFLSQDRSLVQAGKQERVKAVFYSKESNSSPPATTKTSGANRPATPCAG